MSKRFFISLSIAISVIFSFSICLATDGMTDASDKMKNTVNKTEEAVKNTAGVKDAALSFMTLKLKVEFEEGADVDAVMQKAYKNCKKVEDDCEIFL